MKRVALVGVFVLLAAIFAALARQADLWVLDPQGPIALAERNLMVTAALLMLIVVIPVFGMLALFAWRYRDTAGNRAAYTPDWAHNRFEEFVWWAVPFAIILVLAIITWRSTRALDPYQPIASTKAPLEIDVVALDWKWLFIYPAQGIATVNYLEIPDETPVEFKLTADAPMNSFLIPQLSGQVMCMPGMVTQLHVMAQSAGHYTGFSGNFSGDGFAGMYFPVWSVAPHDFDTWVAWTKEASSTLSAAAYRALAQQSEYDAPAFYSSVQDGLYTSIVTKYLEPVSSTTDISM